MLERRPFGGADRLCQVAREVWQALAEEDWREAFSHHPKIGDRPREGRLAATRDLSEREQAGVERAPATVLDQLASANREYEARFGYIFIVCTTGKSAEEMLGCLRERLTNDPAAEIRIAADEQAKITEMRLKSYFSAGAT